MSIKIDGKRSPAYHQPHDPGRARRDLEAGARLLGLPVVPLAPPKVVEAPAPKIDTPATAVTPLPTPGSYVTKPLVSAPAPAKVDVGLGKRPRARRRRAKSVAVMVRVSPEFKAILDGIAQKTGMSVSDVITSALLVTYAK